MFFGLGNFPFSAAFCSQRESRLSTTSNVTFLPFSSFSWLVSLQLLPSSLLSFKHVHLTDNELAAGFCFYPLKPV